MTDGDGRSSMSESTQSTGRFAGRRVLVTGASRGIGADVAVAFARGGAAVAVNGRSESDPLQEVAQRCRDAGAPQVVLAVGDVSDAEQADAVVRQAVDGLGGVDVLVNNAGTLHSAPLVEVDVEQWDAMVASDLRSVYLCTHAALPAMLERGWGRVINITSQLAVKGAPGMAHYSAAKAGVIGFTRSVAQEVAGQGVLVNAVAPGPVDTDMTGDLDDEWKAQRTASAASARTTCARPSSALRTYGSSVPPSSTTRAAGEASRAAASRAELRAAVLGRREHRAADVEQPQPVGGVDDDALHRDQPFGVGVAAGVVAHLVRERGDLAVAQLADGEAHVVAPLRVADEDAPGVRDGHARRHRPLEQVHHLELAERPCVAGSAMSSPHT